MNPILLPWGIELGLITWRDLRTTKHLPAPSEFLAVSAIFGALAMVPQDSDWGKLANLFGWGLVVATLLEGGNKNSKFYTLLVNPTNTPGQPGFVQTPGQIIV